MCENHQDKTESKSMATEDKVLLPPSSTKNQRMSSRLKNRTGFWGYDKVTVEYDKDGQHTKTTREHQPGKPSGIGCSY